MEANDTSQSDAAWRQRRNTILFVLVFAGIFLVGRITPFAPVQRVFGSFSWLTEQAIEIVSDLFESHGLWVVFLGPLLENTLFIGAIVPGTIVMLFGGVAVENGIISYWPAILLGIAGAIIGDTISYGMGRIGRQRLGPESRLGRWAEQMREPLMEHSVWIVLSYHFAGYSRLIGPAAAGFLRMPFFRWAMLDYAGVAIWVISFMTGGVVLAKALGIELGDEAGSSRNVQIFEFILFAFFGIALLSVLRAADKQRKRHDGSMTSAAPSVDGPRSELTAEAVAVDEERRDQIR